MVAVFISETANLLLWIILVLSATGLVAIIYHQLLRPYIIRRESEFYDPPKPGKTYPILVDELARIYRFRVGQRTGELPTRCSAISEDHLDFSFKKSRDSENYEIIIKKNGSTLFKAPRMEHYAKMESSETIQSHEIIGHNAQFRISDKLVKDRMINYIELTLSSEFFFTKMGKERLKFNIIVSSINPGINTSVKNSARVYPFGKSKNTRDNEDTESENQEDEELN